MSEENEEINRRNEVSTFAKVVYSLPGIAYRSVEMFDSTFQTKFYVDDVRIEPMRFGMLHASVRAIETILFPFWGWIMDTHSVPSGLFKGRRHFFFILWAPIKAGAVIFLYLPPHASSMGTIVSSYVVCALLHGIFPLGIPWMALGAEVTQDNAVRSSVFAWRAVFSGIGRIVGAAMPALLVAHYHGNHFYAFGSFASTMGILTIASFWTLACFTDYREDPKERADAIVTRPWKLWESAKNKGATPMPFVAGLRNCFSNVPYMVLLTGNSVSAMAGMFSEGLLPFYVQYVLQPESYELWVSIILIVGLVSALVATPFWMWVSVESCRACARQEILRRDQRPLKMSDYLCLPPEWHSSNHFRRSAMANSKSAGFLGTVDKRFTWLAGWVLALPASIIVFTCVGAGDERLFACCHVWIGLTMGGVHYLHRPIRADCIDYDELTCGLRREAQFVCYMEMIPRWLHIPSSVISMGILSSWGYKAGGERGTVQPDGVIFALKVMVVLVPACCSIFSWCIITVFYPITDAVHARIVEGLQKHSRGQAALDPITEQYILPPAKGDRGPNCLFDNFDTNDLLTIIKEREEATAMNVNSEESWAGDADENAVLITRSRGLSTPGASIQYRGEERHSGYLVNTRRSNVSWSDCSKLAVKEYWLVVVWTTIFFVSACCYMYGISRRGHIPTVTKGPHSRNQRAVVESNSSTLAISGLLLASISVLMIIYHGNLIKPAKQLQHDSAIDVNDIKHYLRVHRGVRFPSAGRASKDSRIV